MVLASLVYDYRTNSKDFNVTLPLSQEFLEQAMRQRDLSNDYVNIYQINYFALQFIINL